MFGSVGYKAWRRGLIQVLNPLLISPKYAKPPYLKSNLIKVMSTLSLVLKNFITSRGG